MVFLNVSKLGKIANFCKFLAGSFSAVSKRNFARKYAFDSIFQALQDLHTFAPLQSQNFSKNWFEKSAIFVKIQQHFCKCCKICKIFPYFKIFSPDSIGILFPPAPPPSILGLIFTAALLPPCNSTVFHLRTDSGVSHLIGCRLPISQIWAKKLDPVQLGKKSIFPWKSHAVQLARVSRKEQKLLRI